jgi:nucleoside-diphosphate-sugar epimerase
MTKKVLIKGGLGLIGSKLVQKFIPESCGLIDFDVAVVRNY